MRRTLLFVVAVMAAHPATVSAEERCKSAHCDEYGQCELIDGVCTATPETCAKVDACKKAGCEIENNMCMPKE